MTNSRRRKDAKDLARGIRNGQGSRTFESAERRPYNLGMAHPYRVGYERGVNFRDRARLQAEERERERSENNERIKDGVVASRGGRRYGG